jgi:hypothetical protein
MFDIQQRDGNHAIIYPTGTEAGFSRHVHEIMRVQVSVNTYQSANTP